MDRKSIIILVGALLLVVVLSPLVDHFFPPKPVPLSALTTNQTSFTSTSGSNESSGSNGPATVYSTATGLPAAPERTLTVSNEDLIFQFTSHGGGLKTVSLQHYPAVINRTGSTSSETNMVTLNLKAPAPVLGLLGDDIQGNNDFALSRNGRIVTATKTLTNGLRLDKEFDISTNYLFTAHLRLENTSTKPLTIPDRQVVIGTATCIAPLDDPTTLGTFWYNGIKAVNIKQPWFANHALGCAILPGTPRAEYVEGASNVVWAAVHNQFFTLAAIPGRSASRLMIHPITVSPPDLVGLTNRTSAFLTNGYEATLWYPGTTLQPHQTLDESYTFYAGPKEYNTLARIGQQMGNRLDLIMDFSGFFGFFSKLLLLSMNGLHFIGVSYGMAIIAITVIIKVVFWPLTQASTRSQKRLQALQPQIKAISDKYKDDPVKKNQKTMEFMKEHKVSPLGSCLPTVFQIPVFFGFYWMLRNSIELRGVHFLWAHDLSQPDTVTYISGFPLNPLPLIMGATQLWQAQLLPPSPGMDPGQQKIMRYMPLMFVAMLYRMSAGLTLYWTVQNLLSILQTSLIKSTTDPVPGKPGTVAPMKKK
jgi:YidC/Oxa1 family membrane protein insertase